MSRFNRLKSAYDPDSEKAYCCPIGYSGHEVGIMPTVVAVSLGACLVERHITLDRAMWGSDHAASVQTGGFERLVKYIRVREKSLGDGQKRVYDSELPLMRKLRRCRREPFSFPYGSRSCPRREIAEVLLRDIAAS